MPDGADVPSDVESRLGASRGGGVALPNATRAYMESRFGYDFSDVRVHTGGASDTLNRDLNSLAFTTGHDIYFAGGQFRPGTRSGDHLLAHELTHVVQQSPNVIRRQVLFLAPPVRPKGTRIHGDWSRASDTNTRTFDRH